MLPSRPFKWVVVLLIGGILLACIDMANPFKTFTPYELVGTWQAKYENFWNFKIEVTGVETIILKADGTYQQIYDDGKGYRYESSWNRWRLERGRRLYLKDGRFYAMGIEWAESWRSGVHTFIAHDFERIDLEGETIFFVYPTSLYPGGAYLFSSLVGDLDAPKWVRFYRVSDSVSVVTPRP